MKRETLFASVREALAWCALGSAALAPFLFGAVERRVWMPLCLAWLGMGLVSARLRATYPTRSDSESDACSAVSTALVPLHALLAVQLIPLPASVLHVLSPGSYAAHFLPDPGDGRFQPLSVSPGATIEAWFYIAALQGLFLAVHGLSRRRRGTALQVITGSALALAAEGLWQSRSAQPFYLYARIPTDSPQGLEASTYGPYFNRNHFATVTALGCGIASGLTTATARAAGGVRRLLTSRESLPRVVMLGGVAAFLGLASAASGSRSGTMAAVAAVAVVTLSAFGRRAFVAAAGVGAGLVLIAGPASVERLSHLDLMASRVRPWMDMTILFRFFPVFGSGIGAFGAAYWPYQRNATYEFWQHAHNEYLEWLIDGGVLGVFVLGFVLRSLIRALRLDVSSRQAMLGGLVAVLVQSVLDFPMRIPANAGLFVCLLALTVIPAEDRS